MSETVLVTGGAGFIGSHLVDALLARGHGVRVLDNLLEQAHPTGTARHLSGEAELWRQDVRDRAAVDAALEGVEVVYHLAGMVGNGQSMFDVRRYVDINATGTATLMEAIAARREQIRRHVMASSMVVYGDGAYKCPAHGRLRAVERPEARLARGEWEPVCPVCGEEVSALPTDEDQTLAPTSTYGISKLIQEQLALTLGQTLGVPTVALRFLNVYGSRQALSNPYTGVAAIMTTRLLNGKPPLVFEDGGQRRDLVHVGDVVSALMASADAPESSCYRPINIGTGRSHSILEIARLLARTLGIQIEPQLPGEYRQGDIRHCFADVSRARSLLGWEARTRLEDGVSELAAWAAGEQAQDLTDVANAELRALGIIR
jgi:dTDP-L-rhamnose 4-epimerase